MKIVFCTQNMAPFRMKWMDEIGKYHQVIIYHLNEYEKDQNLKYISYTPKRATVKCSCNKAIGTMNRFKIEDIINEHADIYLLDGYGFAGQLELIIHLTRKRIPFLMSIDGGFIKTNEPWYKRYFKSFFISKASGYLSTSDETDKYIDYYGGKGKKKYRHYFSNLTNAYIEHEPLTHEQKKRVKAELGIRDTFTIIAVGKAQYVKGFDLLISATNEINEDYDLIFIGVSDSKQYDSLISTKSKDKIHFVDFCDSNMLKKYYQAADLFILPTRGDVWGLVVSEAMANGVSVVTTNRCLAGMAMLQKDEIIPSDDINAIINVIKAHMVYSDEDRILVGKRNIEKAKMYTIEKATKIDIDSFQDFLINKE